jgi:hypothetical protein
MVRVIWIVVAGVAAVGASLAGYRMVESRVAADIYRQRLSALGADYEALRSRYNEAVRKTAVTELLVKDNALSVVVRTSEGVQETQPTPFDPAGEIYVDFVVQGGRLLIRRLFDERTSPSLGMVVDPALVDIDWDDPRLSVGKAVYRRLSEGRWVVTVTGDGSLGLARQDDPRPGTLPAPPDIRDYDEIEKTLAAEIERIDASDVWGWITGSGGK